MNKEQYDTIVSLFWEAFNLESDIRITIKPYSKSIEIEEADYFNIPNFYAYIDEYSSSDYVDGVIENIKNRIKK